MAKNDMLNTKIQLTFQQNVQETKNVMKNLA